MKKLLYDIYENMAEKIPYWAEAEQIINDEVKAELAKYKGKISEGEWETLCGLCFSAVYVAKREWFIVGFHYAVEMLFIEESIEKVYCEDRKRLRTEDILNVMKDTYPLSKLLKEDIEKMEKIYKDKNFKNASA